jgi:pimeloyl-ACP methyl ester carboxylesterase
MKNRLARSFVPLGVAALAFSLSASAAQLCPGPDRSRREIATTETRLASVPALVRIPPQVTRPPILLWHGFGPPASERALMEALPLDDVPAIKIYLGLPQFGAREQPNGREDMIRRQSEDLGRLVFEPVVVGAAQELPAVVAALQRQGCLRSRERVSLFGFSAGGASTLFALAERKTPVSAAVIVNASTGLSASVEAYEQATKQQYKWSEYTRELAQRTDAVQRAADIARDRPALLIVQGGNDTMISGKNAFALFNALQPYYKESAEAHRVRLHLVDGLTHTFATSDHLDELRRTIAEWFNSAPT